MKFCKILMYTGIMKLRNRTRRCCELGSQPLYAQKIAEVRAILLQYPGSTIDSLIIDTLCHSTAAKVTF